jgi:enamine deaminase RidA (YjgF/YER057c/UK114 family)
VKAACRVAFGAASAGVRNGSHPPQLEIPLPVLAGGETECLLKSAEPIGTQEGFALFQGEHGLAGFAVAPAGADLEAATEDLYRRLFAITAEHRLFRIWNYVPRINAVEHGLENYRRFCRGRSLAFERQFGRTFQTQLPAASAVGAGTGPLAIAFVAGDAAARHFENPRQVPAFEYPADYGPRSPSFSRATQVETETGRQLFISGTAAIRGHATIAPDDLGAQLDCTVENLNLIAETAEAGKDCGADGWQRSFKIYLRHRAEFAPAREFLTRNFFRPGDQTIYLLADLCRADLRVEIEAVLSEKR